MEDHNTRTPNRRYVAERAAGLRVDQPAGPLALAAAVLLTCALAATGCELIDLARPPGNGPPAPAPGSLHGRWAALWIDHEQIDRGTAAAMLARRIEPADWPDTDLRLRMAGAQVERARQAAGAGDAPTLDTALATWATYTRPLTRWRNWSPPPLAEDDAPVPDQPQ